MLIVRYGGEIKEETYCGANKFCMYTKLVHESNLICNFYGRSNKKRPFYIYFYFLPFYIKNLKPFLCLYIAFIELFWISFNLKLLCSIKNFKWIPRCIVRLRKFKLEPFGGLV